MQFEIKHYDYSKKDLIINEDMLILDLDKINKNMKEIRINKLSYISGDISRFKNLEVFIWGEIIGGNVDFSKINKNVKELSLGGIDYTKFNNLKRINATYVSFVPTDRDAKLVVMIPPKVDIKLPKNIIEAPISKGDYSKYVNLRKVYLYDDADISTLNKNIEEITTEIDVDFSRFNKLKRVEYIYECENLYHIPKNIEIIYCSSDLDYTRFPKLKELHTIIEEPIVNKNVKVIKI